jgi:hypothetical protein
MAKADIMVATRDSVEALHSEGVESFTADDVKSREDPLLADATPGQIDKALEEMKDLLSIRHRATRLDGIAEWTFQ